MEGRQRRRQKQPKAAANRINELPNDILRHIISFLPTKEAVATSILSKRWIGLWISVHFTNIRVDTMKSHHKFNKSVYAALASRGEDPDYIVDSFHLDIEYGNRNFAKRSFPHVVRWINLVVQCELKHLYLNHVIDDDDDNDAFGQEGYYPRLPRSIFTCRTLVRLDISRFSVEGHCVSSVKFGFPSLKTLRFDDVSCVNDRNFALLLSACPVLEDLQLFNCWNSLNFRGDPVGLQMFRNLSLPKLTRADILECDWSFYPLKAFSTAKSLRLRSLKLYTEDDEKDDEDNQLQRPCHYDDIPIFHNLTYLKLHNSWNLVLQMLYKCSKLQSLELSKEWNSSRECNQENLAEELEFVPQCLSSCLITCTIRDIGGQESELQESELMLATFILKNAKNLQTMKIWTQWNRDKHEVEAKLSQCPKASATCQLLVH